MPKAVLLHHTNTSSHHSTAAQAGNPPATLLKEFAARRFKLRHRHRATAPPAGKYRMHSVARKNLALACRGPVNESRGLDLLAIGDRSAEFPDLT